MKAAVLVGTENKMCPGVISKFTGLFELSHFHFHFFLNIFLLFGF